MIEVLCISDSDKPKEIPLGNWIQKGMIYHITHIHFHHFQAIQGVDLHEVKLTPECYPYETYRLSRFAINLEQLNKFIQMMKDCTELNDVQIDELIKESDLQLIDEE